MAWRYEGVEGSKVGQIAGMMMGGPLGDGAAPRHIWFNYDRNDEPYEMAWAYVSDFPQWSVSVPEIPPNSTKVHKKKLSGMAGAMASKGNSGDGGLIGGAVGGPAGGMFFAQRAIGFAIIIVVVLGMLFWMFFQNPGAYLKENDEANQRADAAAEQSQTAESPDQSATSGSKSDASTTSTSENAKSAAAPAISGAAYDKLDDSLNGSYAYVDGSDASDSEHGGHFGKFKISQFNKDEGTFRVDFEWYDEGASSATISGDLTARYVGESDLGDFSKFKASGKTSGNLTVNTTAEFRVYPNSSKLTIAHFEVVATDSSGKEVYHMSIASYDMTK